MIMRKMIPFLMFFLLISGCTPLKQDTLIKWVVSDNMFMNSNEKIEYGKPIKNQYVDAYNQTLKEKGYAFQIEVVYYDSSKYDQSVSHEDLIKEIERDFPDADVVNFYMSAIDHYEVLDEYFKSSLGEKLRSEIPENVLQYNKINSSIYGIEKNTFKYATSAYSFLPEYYNRHKQEIEKYKDDPILLLKKLSVYKDWNTKEILTYPQGFDLYTLLEQQYQSIQLDENDSGLFIRRSDKKIVSIFDDPQIKDTILLLAKLGQQNAYGGQLSSTDLNTISQERKFSMITIPYEYPEELYEKYKSDDERILIRYGREKLLQSAKLSILKTSKNKQEAFESIALMNTDRECANAMIYGESIKDSNEIIHCETSMPGGNWNSYGNYLIANQTENEPNNKKELAFEYANRVDISKQISPYFQFQDKKDTVEQLIEIYTSQISNICINEKGEDENLIKKQLDKLESQFKQFKLDELISFFQNQIDSRN